MNYIILQYFINLFRVTLSISLFILYRLEVLTLQGTLSSIPFGHIPVPIHQKKLPIPFEDCGLSLTALTSHILRLPQGWKIHHTS